MLQVDRILNSIFDSITWLLSETEGNQVWLVDCGDIIPILGKKKKQEMCFFLNKHEKASDNKKCKECRNKCKQSFRAVIVRCPNYNPRNH